MAGRKEDTACYRLYAANCLEIARRVSDTNRRLFLLKMAQAWGRLADQVENQFRTAGEGEAPGEPGQESS
jgi:hypothetical protein